jgi:hypothetical protein
MKILKILLFVGLVACSKSNDPSKLKHGEYSCSITATSRVGAMCTDGTREDGTSATTCSAHGGVSFWICK